MIDYRDTGVLNEKVDYLNMLNDDQPLQYFDSWADFLKRMCH